MESEWKPPNWQYWCNLADVELLQAVELSLNLEPGWLCGAGVYCEEIHGKLPIAVKMRRDIASSHVTAGTLACERRLLPTNEFPFHGSQLECVVLTEFRKWGESLPVPFTFPDGFPRAAQSESDSARYIANNESETANPRERASMLRIIRALGVMAKLPERGASASVEWQLQELGFASPKEATIRALLREAAALRSD